MLIFTGTLNHPPNAEGIAWFADEVWPEVAAARPDARLMVVGREPPPAVARLGSRPGIEVVGPVADMREWYGRATAAVVPLLSGGGSRLKILEALACGRALVSTPVGAEGLDLQDGRDLLLAADASAFAAATLRLLAEPDLRADLAAQGRRAAERRYDWRVLGDSWRRRWRPRRQVGGYPRRQDDPLGGARRARGGRCAHAEPDRRPDPLPRRGRGADATPPRRRSSWTTARPTGRPGGCRPGATASC